MVYTPAMQSSDPRFEVREVTPDVGSGLFALQAIKKGDFILEYIGKKITAAETEGHTGRYLFELDSEWTIDGDVPENLARFINHSCDPNCEAEVEDGHIMLHALKDIAPGDELTFDYDEEYYDEFIRPVGCRCAAKKHR